MPTFESAKDQLALNTLKANSDKTIVPIPAKSVAFMGGSVRCLSWQLTGENAKKLINIANGKTPLPKQGKRLGISIIVFALVLIFNYIF